MNLICSFQGIITYIKLILMHWDYLTNMSQDDWWLIVSGLEQSDVCRETPAEL